MSDAKVSAVHLQIVDSTQLELKRRLEAAPDLEPTLVTASEQTSGRGRLGRQWIGHENHTLMFSLWCPANNLSVELLPLTSLLAGICTKNWLSPHIDCQLKWPNDLVIKGPQGNYLKLAGILCEGIWSDETPRGVIVGIGINVSWPGGVVPNNIGPVTCIQDFSNVTFDVLRESLNELADMILSGLEQLRLSGPQELASTVNSALVRTERTVTLKSFDGDHIVGYIEGVSDLGKLLFKRQDDASIIEVDSGELDLGDLPVVLAQNH